MEYSEEDFLQLSGIQHYIFCRRQWALIHLEQQWAENERTVDGKFMHEHAHDAASHEKRGSILIARGMYIHSRQLGLSGQCDIVEFHRTDLTVPDEDGSSETHSPEGIPLHGYSGLWLPYPVEYKRGHAKPDRCDEAQVCAQAVCLEEMYCCHVHYGAIYYGQNRRRIEVEFTEELRETVRKSSIEMHDLYYKGYTPKAHRRKCCESCSLMEQCMPELPEEGSVALYLQRMKEMDA